MKTIYIVVLAFLTLSCSIKNQPYYFSYYKKPVVKSPVEMTDTAPVSEVVAVNESQIIELPEFSASVNNAPVVAVAKSSKASVAAPPAIAEDKQRSDNTGDYNARKNVSRKELKAAVKDSVKKKQNSGDGFAIAGFVCSIVGLFILWPLCILGIIFSALGLKSGRRGLAIAGLVIGIIGVVVVLAAGAAIAGA